MRFDTDVLIDLVLLGAGHAHVEVLRDLARRPDPGLRLTLIAREPNTPYSGRLPALIRGECGPEAAHIDLGPLAAAADARLVIAEATSIDLVARRVAMRDRPAIRFDLLSIDIGGIPAMPQGNGIGVKPIGGFLATLARLETELVDGARIALVGGGAAGTELALALAQRFDGRLRITLVCDTLDPLPEAPPRARAVARAALAEARVELVCLVRAGAQADGRLALSDGSFLAVDAVLWATNVVGPPLLAESGLICDAAGCVVVDASLRSRSHDFVFAVGDCASIATAPRPKSGVWAVRAGPRLADNLRRVAGGLRPRAWRPQATALAIVGLGHGSAVGWRNGIAMSGRFVAWYKDWIDGRFVRRYAPDCLPRRAAQAEPTRVSLDPADLAVLPGPTVQQVYGDPPPLIGAVAPTGVVVLIGAAPPTGAVSPAGAVPPIGVMPSTSPMHPTGAALIQHTIHLSAPLNDPFTFGRIGAAHALVRLHASDGRPWSAVAIVTPEAVPLELARADVIALLQGAASVLAKDGAALADCTTTEGGTPGLSVVLTGRPAPARDQAAAALRPGDALILTKQLGSGIILEAHRRGLAEARWLLGAVEAMVASSAAANRILRQHGATACAAVAEHGLLGTLAALLRDANLAAVLFPDAMLALPGARELADQGVARSIAEENRRAWPDAPDWPDLALLADPQIAGGLLAGVPAAQAPACLAALHAAGYAAACIGQAETRRLDAPRLQLQSVTPGMDNAALDPDDGAA